MQRILFITDNQKSLGPWQQELVRAGYPVAVCGGAQAELIESFTPRPPDILILDGTGLRLTPRELRALLEKHCPSAESCILWLITEEAAAHLEPSAGCDDFIVLPASAGELRARIKLHLWKSHKIDSEDVAVAGGLSIDQANYTVSLHGQRLDLTYKEYELLRFLATHRGRVFTREALLNQVWGYDYYGGTRTVDVHIRRIRAKLGSENEQMIETVRNVGYRFQS